jgi:pSer/pThr/pTyr-binding forkhead associated (FHA) protein
MAKLKVLESAEADLVGKEFEIKAEESWIGRGADAAVFIPDAAISRRHARI